MNFIKKISFLTLALSAFVQPLYGEITDFFTRRNALYAAAGIVPIALAYKTFHLQPATIIKAPDPDRYGNGRLLAQDEFNKFSRKSYNADTPLVGNDRRDYVIYGGDVAYQILHSQESNNSSDSLAHIQKITSLAWFLYSVAIAQGDGFNRGSIVVHDNHKIYDFLKNYVKQVNPNHNKAPSYFSTNPFAYPRHSTHIPHIQQLDDDDYKHYGIDIRFDENEQAANILPCGNRHILFGKMDAIEVDGVQTGRTFIKLEDNGIYWRDGLLAHGWNAIFSVGRKLPYIGQFFGSNDHTEDCKEHLPKVFKNAAQKARVDGKTITELLSNCDPRLSLAKAIKDRYPYDWGAGRLGNEVIILPGVLSKGAEYYTDESKQQESEEFFRTIRETKQQQN